MPITLPELLETSFSLSEKVASATAPGERAALERRQAAVDFATFGMFKQAGFSEALGPLARPLAWGVGLGVPAVAASHAILGDARRQGEALARAARNQALLAAAGVGGMQGLASAIQAAAARRGLQAPEANDEPHLSPSTEPAKLGGLERLAAAVMVDDLLEDAYGAAAEHEKRALLEAIVSHRVDAAALLRSVAR